MRKIERPPFTPQNWDFGELLDELLAKDKYLAAKEIDDSSYPYWEKWKYLAREWGLDPDGFGQPSREVGVFLDEE